jgi:hypothetical protein
VATIVNPPPVQVTGTFTTTPAGGAASSSGSPTEVISPWRWSSLVHACASASGSTSGCSFSTNKPGIAAN